MDPFGSVRNETTNDLLRSSIAVDVSGVNETDAGVGGRSEGFPRLGFGDHITPISADLPCTETNLRHFDCCFSKCSLVHRFMADGVRCWEIACERRDTQARTRDGEHADAVFLSTTLELALLN